MTGRLPHSQARIGKRRFHRQRVDVNARLVGGTTRRAESEDESEGAVGSEQDWREFRARLVLQERQAASTGEAGSNGSSGEQVGSKAVGTQGWAHETPLIERGSVLLSTAGDHFSINQQYFHKAVILIIQHDQNGDVGLILNRPTSFTTNELYFQSNPLPLVPEGTDLLELAASAQQSTDMLKQARWNVWCGGDCQGINDAGSKIPFCLHTSAPLAEFSEEVIKGVFLIPFNAALELVAAGKAEREDFMFLIGYCGWGRGQMQSELDRGDTWTLAAADQRALLGELRSAQTSLIARLDSATEDRKRAESKVPLSASEIGNGIDQWQKLFMALGPRYEEQYANARANEDDEHADEMLNIWIQRCLIPSLGKPVLRSSASLIKAGTIFRGSHSAWILGKPSEDEDFSVMRFRPAQHLHKSVLLLLRDLQEGVPAALILLNGPKIGEMPDGSGDLYFGGTSNLGQPDAEIFEIGGGEVPFRLKGVEMLLPGVLEKLLSLGALEVAQGVDMQTVVSTPRDARWELAGGKVQGLRESWMAAIGDVQRRKWFERFLGMELGSDD